MEKNKLKIVRNKLDKLSICEKLRYVNSVKIRVAIRSKSAIFGICNLKNKVVHDKLNTSCIKKRDNALQYG